MTLKIFAGYFERLKVQITIIALFTLVLYGNTLSHQFALDDGLVILENKFVLAGVSGIPDILTHDSFYSAIGNSANLTGGRYRPLSIIAFAIENQIAGTNPFIFHLFNIIYYFLVCIVFLLLLRRFLLKEQPIAAFIGALLFTIHPVHSEVVANIKSRDELFSLLFMLLTLYFLFRHLNESKGNAPIIWSLFFYCLALLSKENGIILAAIIPATIYFFSKRKPGSILMLSLPYLAVIFLYFLLRNAVLVPNTKEVMEVMDNPYLLATPIEKYATIALVMLKYLLLLCWPQPLTYDYSYHQIPYVDFSSWKVWVSLIVHLLMIVVAIEGIKNRKHISWSILFYLSGLLLVSNLFINIGAPMAERFLFQASVPYVIALIILCSALLRKWKAAEHLKRMTVCIVLIAVVIPFTYITIQRSEVWHSNETLFLNDVKISARSARANAYAGVALIKKCDQASTDSVKRRYAAEALYYLKTADGIKQNYITTLLNMGVAYSRLDSVDAAEQAWAKARLISSGNRNFIAYDKYLGERFYQLGMEKARLNDLTASIAYFEKSVRYQPENADAWYNLGGACFTTGQYEKARQYWMKTLEIKPDYENAKAGLNALETK